MIVFTKATASLFWTWNEKKNINLKERNAIAIKYTMKCTRKESMSEGSRDTSAYPSRQQLAHQHKKSSHFELFFLFQHFTKRKKKQDTEMERVVERKSKRARETNKKHKPSDNVPFLCHPSFVRHFFLPFNYPVISQRSEWVWVRKMVQYVKDFVIKLNIKKLLKSFRQERE